VTAPGTGLGMSIVKQIVDLSGGRVDIRSEPGNGTEVKLSLPLENCLSGSAGDLSAKLDSSYTHEDPVFAVRRRAHGRTVTIRGFDNITGKSNLQLSALTSFKTSIEKYVTQWFDLTIVSNDEDADIVIADESVFCLPKAPVPKFQALLILCSSGARRDIFPYRLKLGQTIEFVSKPCGPHRLAKSLLNCLDKEDATPTIVQERVSSTRGSQNRDVSPSNAMVTAGTSNSRLIGNLQSSIGFSPTTINLVRLTGAPSPDATSESRPTLLQRISDGDQTYKLWPSAPSSPESSSPKTSGVSSKTTPSDSASQLAISNPSSPLDETPFSTRRPKMLLVEVCSINPRIFHY